MCGVIASTAAVMTRQHRLRGSRAFQVEDARLEG